MKHLQIRRQQSVADPLWLERLLKALTIILEHQEDTHASSTLRQGLDTPPTTRSTIESQRRCLEQYIQRQGWGILPEHEYVDEGLSGARLDRPALDRLRDAARRGEFDGVVVLSPDRLARHYAYQWLLVEEFEKLNIQWIFLQNPFGDTPQGKLLIQRQGRMAE